ILIVFLRVAGCGLHPSRSRTARPGADAKRGGANAPPLGPLCRGRNGYLLRNGGLRDHFDQKALEDLALLNGWLAVLHRSSSLLPGRQLTWARSRGHLRRERTSGNRGIGSLGVILTLFIGVVGVQRRTDGDALQDTRRCGACAPPLDRSDAAGTAATTRRCSSLGPCTSACEDP